MSGLVDPTGLSFMQRMDIQREATDVLGRTGLTPCELEAAWLETLGKLRMLANSMATLHATLDVLHGAVDGLADLAGRRASPMQVRS